MSILIIYVQTHLPSWKMGDFPGNKHETLAFNTSLPTALLSSWGGEIAWEHLATRYPTMSQVTVMLPMSHWQHISGLFSRAWMRGILQLSLVGPPYTHPCA